MFLFSFLADVKPLYKSYDKSVVCFSNSYKYLIENEVLNKLGVNTNNKILLNLRNLLKINSMRDYAVLVGVANLCVCYLQSHIRPKKNLPNSYQ
jgi:hypothetical protein